MNGLNLQPGDRVLFKCGDTWRADPLVLSKSGTAAASIEFSSYPAGCADKPVLSGSRAIGGLGSRILATFIGPTCRLAIFRWASTSCFETASG